MEEKRLEKLDAEEESLGSDNSTWQEKAGLSAKTPIGPFGIGLTTDCLTLRS